MNPEFVLRIIAFLVFAVIGFYLSRRLSAPRHSLGWVAWLMAFVFFGYFGVSTRLIAIQGFAFYLNNSLQGITFGLISGWLMAVTLSSNTESKDIH